jgi:hypothetical protein
VLLKKDSIFVQEMLGDIKRGILPESFIGIQIVLPEVFAIEGIKSAEKVQVKLLK